MWPMPPLWWMHANASLLQQPFCYDAEMFSRASAAAPAGIPPPFFPRGAPSSHGTPNNMYFGMPWPGGAPSGRFSLPGPLPQRTVTPCPQPSGVTAAGVQFVVAPAGLRAAADCGAPSLKRPRDDQDSQEEESVAGVPHSSSGSGRPAAARRPRASAAATSNPSNAVGGLQVPLGTLPAARVSPGATPHVRVVPPTPFGPPHYRCNYCEYTADSGKRSRAARVVFFGVKHGNCAAGSVALFGRAAFLGASVARAWPVRQRPCSNVPFVCVCVRVSCRRPS